MRWLLLSALLNLIVNGVRSIYNIQQRFSKKVLIAHSKFLQGFDRREGKHIYNYNGHLSNTHQLHKLFESNDVYENILSLDVKDNLATYLEEIRDLRGTPALVDRLENLASRFPGIELNMELYRNLYSFPLDDFQERGLSALIEGNNVVVSTPTGSGKTLVGELAIYFALMLGLRVAYTTPLKALSNQKFQDFKRRYGGDRVGLLTGDIAINRGAPITIMTTEVFRNMIYDQDSQNQLSNLFMVCFDEFHFMNDPDRGTVWEESVISCPRSVRILALSATMGNVHDIKGWITSIHGPTELVLSEHRPVPLRYFFAMKQGLFPLFRDPNAGPGALQGVPKQDGNLAPGANINPTLTKLEDQFVRGGQAAKNVAASRAAGADTKGNFRGAFKGGGPSVQSLIPTYGTISEELLSLKKLPAIVFIFSRAGCEQAAKSITQGKLKLLTADEDEYVKNAVNAFVIANPDIPVAKGSIQMLRAGVGVHHAGLISVWKAFIEDLFNANKIKILFATETLAAGVNMPARTTVISTVTKRINSEVVKLKTSQLLQMAGRAGRRGKDTEGTVVIMRNRFEDVKMSHKILTSPTDGIKSHFKTSYGLCVKLLETKSLNDCKELIERGFGAYLLQKRAAKKMKENVVNNVEQHRKILQKYTLAGAREYLKLLRRMEKEKKNYEFLVSKMLKSEYELVQAIAEYMPVGIGIQLQNYEVGFFLGDVNWRSGTSFDGYGVITKEGQVLLARKEHIRSFADTEDCIPPKTAQTLLELVSLCNEWEEVAIENCQTPLLVGAYPPNEVFNDVKIQNALDTLSSRDPFPSPPQSPGSIIKQKSILKSMEEQLKKHPISLAVEEGEGERVIDALRYASTLKDPVAFANEKTKKLTSGEEDAYAGGEIFAWKMFQNVYQILQKFEALKGTNATDLGEMVGSLSSDNELWLALVLRHPSVQTLNAAEFGAVICSVVVDGYKAGNAFFKDPPSATIKSVLKELEPVQWELQSEQTDALIDFPVHLSVDAAGMVESWVRGTSWRELCKETSLDQGDICRMLRRTVEALRQIPNAYGVPPNVAQLSYEAAQRMDRFPVADFAEVLGSDPSLAAAAVDGDVKKSTAGLGFEFGGTAQSADGFDSDVEESERNLLLQQFLDEDEENEFQSGDSEDLLASDGVNQRVDDLNAFLDSIQSDDNENDDPFSAAITRSVSAADLKAKKRKEQQIRRESEALEVDDDMDSKENDSILEDMEALLFEVEEDGGLGSYIDEETEGYEGYEEIEDDSGGVR